MTSPEADFYYVKWEDKFKIGIEEIDLQHKILIQNCNTLYLELMQHKKVGTPSLEDSVARALKECVDYVKIHFAFEENLIKMANYPDFESHKMKHAVFIRKVLETSETFKSANFSSALAFVKFLYEWILTHIAYEDKLYVPYVKKMKQENQF